MGFYIATDMELARSTSHGGFSVRGFFIAFISVLLAVFSGQLLFSTSVSANDKTASWNGAMLVLDHNSFISNGEPTTENQIEGIPADSQYYVYIETISDRPLKQKAHVI